MPQARHIHLNSLASISFCGRDSRSMTLILSYWFGLYKTIVWLKVIDDEFGFSIENKERRVLQFFD